MYTEQLITLWATVGVSYIAGQLPNWQPYAIIALIYVLVYAGVTWFIQTNPNLLNSLP